MQIFEIHPFYKNFDIVFIFIELKCVIFRPEIRFKFLNLHVLFFFTSVTCITNVKCKKHHIGYANRCKKILS